MDSRPVYRSNAGGSPVFALMDKGRSLREAAGFDPHRLTAPTELAAPRASMLEELAAMADDGLEKPRPWWWARRDPRLLVANAPAIIIYSSMFFAAIAIVALFSVVASMYGRWIVLLAPFTVLLVVVPALLARGANESPRRWLSRTPLRIEGYDELFGREERLERLRVVVRFASHTSPDLDAFKDLLTGAAVRTQGVVALDPQTFAVHSPELQGKRSNLHPWIQRLCDGALVPLSDEWPVALVRIEER
ncbi:MAG: hypothetical protein JNK05_17065 [Myxococcales bacterium]|nr:hypothetical protein [Myxococcales bacterium]